MVWWSGCIWHLASWGHNSPNYWDWTWESHNISQHLHFSNRPNMDMNLFSILSVSQECKLLWNIISLKYLFFFEKQSDRERKTERSERESALVHFAYGGKSWSWAGLKEGAKHFFWVSDMNAGAQRPGPWSATFLRILCGSWIRSGAAGTLISSLMGWWCNKWTPSVQHHGASLRKTLLNSLVY